MVPAYLNNDVKRFKVYVANRVQLIHDHSDQMQWNYIESKKNPADDTSCGVLPSNAAKVKHWVNGSKISVVKKRYRGKKTVVVNTISSMKENIVTGLQL